MNAQMELILGIVNLNNQELVGKTRFQKTVYLLKEVGIEIDFNFDYSHYGPYSSDLSDTIDFCISEGRLISEQHPGYHEIPYTVFTTNFPDSYKFDRPFAEKISNVLEILDNYSAIILELASTIRYFSHLNDKKLIESEVKTRKPLKATDERLKKSWVLLKELSIA